MGFTRLGRLAPFLLLLACLEKEKPGQSLGTFRVVSSLAENTCGSSAVGAIDPLVYDIELRKGNGVVYWIRGRAPAVTAPMDRNGGFVLRSNLEQLFAKSTADEAACVAEQREVLRATLKSFNVTAPDGGVPAADAGADAGATIEVPTFSGENTIDFSPTATSNCARMLAAYGGPFAALPCRVRYTLQADVLPTE